MADDMRETSTPDYNMGYEDAMQRMLRSRTAATHAAYLLPYLKPGMRVLDIGCGPGTISVGLASAVEPGEFYGIDMEDSQVQQAIEAAREGGHSNSRFQVADALNPTFPDNHFDVVHCHSVLNHIPDTMALLANIKRVLKSGGILAARDMIADSSFIEPDLGNLKRVYPILASLAIATDGHPQIGKEHRARFSEAGFVDIESTGSFESFGSPSGIAAHTGLLIALPFADQAISHGIATREEFDELRKDALAWQYQPGAFAAFAFGETIARKP